ncbi:MAG TPA: hypothetical protein VIG99_06630, partial [Myxococcaceae bacterium]
TKCSHTFRVKRGADGSALIVPSAPSAAPPVAAVPENPFAQFAPVPGGDMFSQSTRVAPMPTRPEPATEKGAKPPPAPQEITRRGPAPTDVTVRAPVPTRDALAEVFGLEPDAVTHPAAVFGGKVSSSARTDPAAIYGGGGALPPSPAPSLPPIPPSAPPASIQIDAALPSGPPPKGNVPGGFDPSTNTVLSSGPSSGPYPQASQAWPQGASSSDSNPFASGPSSGGFPAAGPPDHSLFDIPPPPPEAATHPGPDGAAENRFGAPAGLDALAAPPPSPMMQPPQRPAGRPEDARGVEEYSTPGAARRYAGLVTNLAVAAGLMMLLVTGGSVYLNEGKLDLSAFSGDRMAALFAARRTADVTDVSNGLYETKTGRSVFFVRGVVHNRTEAPLQAKVRAEILDGAELVRAAEGMAGAAPTPEEVYGLASSADQAKLSARLNQEARPLPPGADAPFFLLFDFGDAQQSPDLATYRLRVSVSEGAMTADAAAPR